LLTLKLSDKMTGIRFVVFGIVNTLTAMRSPVTGTRFGYSVVGTTQQILKVHSTMV
jgi:hypothetical protein